MKNLLKLKEKCEGFTPLSVVTYVEKRLNDTPEEALFAKLMVKALKKINERARRPQKVFMYKTDGVSLEKASKDHFLAEIFNEHAGDMFIKVYRYKEGSFYHYLMQAKQFGEPVEILFLEEIPK